MNNNFSKDIYDIEKSKHNIANGPYLPRVSSIVASYTKNNLDWTDAVDYIYEVMSYYLTDEKVLDHFLPVLDEYEAFIDAHFGECKDVELYIKCMGAIHILKKKPVRYTV